MLFFFSSRRRHTRSTRDWSSDVCSSDLHIPYSLPFERAALTEPCCVGYNAVAVKSHIRPGDVVVVLGPGPIGLLCAEMARIAGAGTLIVSGMAQDKSRLEAARALGATHAINCQETDL